MTRPEEDGGDFGFFRGLIVGGFLSVCIWIALIGGVWALAWGGRA